MKNKKLLKLVLIFVITLSLVLGIGYAYLNSKYSKMYQKRTKEEHDITITDDTKKDDDKLKEDSEKTLEGSINILLLGTDESGARTDTAILVHYDTYSKSTSLFSIPRDYMITLSDKAQEQLNYYAPFIKFTEIMAYLTMAEHESPSSYIAQVVEELLGVKIDHFVLVDLSAFRAAVDSIGGVEAYVPQRMRWNDPIQGLYIDLEPGVQLLNGEQAEGLVRFRQGYDGNSYGDYGRMEVQQYFLTAYVKKLLRVENLAKIDQIIEPLSKLLTTDASLADALLLVNTAKDADFNRINSHTLVGYENMVEGKFFFSPPPPDELKRYFLETIVSDTSLQISDSKSYKIEVYSAQYDTSAAEKSVAALTKDGYQVEFMGVDPGPRSLKSIIKVPEAGLGSDLKKYLDISEVVVDSSLLKDEDSDDDGKTDTDKKKKIVIIVGEVQAPSKND